MILKGDALQQLKTLPDNSVDMCITSPPYYNLRDYNVDGQLGMEASVEEYISNLCDVFDEAKRVIKNEGTCWVNIGDGYNNKALQAVPFRFALEMINRGWMLRNTIIWHKPSVIPSSAKDRFTIDFEYLFFFSQQKKYYFKQQLEPYSDIYLNDKRVNKDNIVSKTSKYDGKNIQGGVITRNNIFKSGIGSGRNKRCVWSINPARCKEAHFAVFPEKLIEIPIDAGCPVGGIALDMFFGAGTTGIVALKQNKKYIGIELNQEYIEIAKKRIYETEYKLGFLKN